MLKVKLARLLVCAMAASILLSPTLATASAPLDQKTLTICTSLKTGYQTISKTGKCNERNYETRTWYKAGSAPAGTPGSQLLNLSTCISKGSSTQIILTRSSCNLASQVGTQWQRPLGPPLAPSIRSVAMGLAGTATLSITAPLEDGGAGITSYVVTATPGQIRTTLTPSQIKAAPITGLTPGVTYSFDVVAINSKGPSPTSPISAPILAPDVPTPPSITDLVATGTNSVELTFTAPISDGRSPITSYVATSIPSGLQTTVHQSTGGTMKIKNLTHSTSYRFTLVAYNAAGASPASAISATVSTAIPVPAPPAPVAPETSAPADTVISVAAVAGVTAPVTGATPVTTTTAGTGYTGTVTWSGSPTTFAPGTTYTATITLTPASGYTLTGVSANFFTVAGATSDTNPANSGVITAVFPATAYRVGDTGPGGGRVFYVASTPFTCGAARTSTCSYLEAAPSSWNPLDSAGRRLWAKTENEYIAVNNVSAPETARATAIGWGYWNTRAIILQGNTDTATSAAALADSYTVTVSGVVYDDWYLPSRDELNQMCKWQKGITGEALITLTTACTGAALNVALGAEGFLAGDYWSSSELIPSDSYYQNFTFVEGDPRGAYGDNAGKNNTFITRPVRAF